MGGRKIPQQKFFICPPHAKQNQKIHTYILSDFFSNLCTFNSYCQKILKKAYLHQIKQICKKKRSKKSFKKFLVQHCTCTQSKKKKTNKKLSSNYIKLNIVCKYARKNKS